MLYIFTLTILATHFRPDLVADWSFWQLIAGAILVNEAKRGLKVLFTF